MQDWKLSQHFWHNDLDCSIPRSRNNDIGVEVNRLDISNVTFAVIQQPLIRFCAKQWNASISTKTSTITSEKLIPHRMQRKQLHCRTTFNVKWLSRKLSKAGECFISVVIITSQINNRHNETILEQFFMQAPYLAPLTKMPSRSVNRQTSSWCATNVLAKTFLRWPLLFGG